MKRSAFLFLLAALLIPLFTSQVRTIDLKKGGAAPIAPGVSEFTVDVSLLGEKGDVYQPGNQIRLSFQTTKDAYVVIYDVDVDGNVQLLYPEDGRPVISEGRKAYFLPAPGKGEYWTTGRTTGVEYIHAVAVTDPARFNDTELHFLAENGSLSSGKQFHVDLDPYLAFNLIDEELVNGAENDPPATDFTYFYINKHVEYPRYLCSKCHSPDKLPDPYAMECREIVIEKIAYDEEPHYPYPPLYNIRHVGEAAKEDTAYSSDRYRDNWVDRGEDTENEDNTRLYIPVGYGGHPFWGYGGPTLLAFDPFYWDPFWWDFNWGFFWGDYYWWPSYGWWYPPSYYWGYHYRFPWWGCHDDWRYCGRGWGPGEWGHRPIYGNRAVVKRSLDYTRTNVDMHRNRAIAGSRFVHTQNRDLARSLGRSRLERRAINGAVERASVGGELGRARSRELTRTVIYGGDVGRRGMNRTSGNVRVRASGPAREPVTGRTREGAGANGERQIQQPRDNSGRGSGYGGRDVIRRAGPERRSSNSGRSESTRSRSSYAPTRGSSGSVGRSGSSGDRRRASVSMNEYGRGYRQSQGYAPARSYGGAERATSRGASAAPASARTSSAPASSGRSRSR
ncbi:MAG TPA: DUF4384 domain-containing protein [Candidatus Bathyarchaeia archaeon]|nr:DUF4384 domain-containing protein [Candidatus Bathyarchaeia archaeon]